MTAMFFRFSLIGLATVLAASLPLFGQSSDSRPTPEPTPVRQRVNLNTTPAEQAAFDEAKAIDDEGNK